MNKIEITLPQPVIFILVKLIQAGYEAYVVGGAVRDGMMGKEITDWDLTTEAKPEEIQALFKSSFYNNEYGTVSLPALNLIEEMKTEGWLAETKGWTEAEVLEITTFRTEVNYSDNRRPDRVSWGNSLVEDLARRDFTINAMALSFGGREAVAELQTYAKQKSEWLVPMKLSDPYQGRADLEQKIIRAVREPRERFTEDALRMMRAVRLGAQLGFAIETKTLTAIQEKAALINKISAERLRDEWLKILASGFPAEGITLLENTGLLAEIMPELSAMKGVKQGGHHIYDVWKHSLEALRECPSRDPIVRMATLLHDIGKPKVYREQGPRGVTFYGHEVVGARMAKQIGDRLRLSKREVERLFILVRWHMFVYNPEMTDAAIRRFIRRVGLENINDMMLLRVGDRKGGGSRATSWRLRELQERIGQQLYEPLRLKDMVVDGKDVMQVLKIKPGRKVGQILDQLFEEVLEDSQKNQRQYLLGRIQELGEK